MKIDIEEVIKNKQLLYHNDACFHYDIIIDLCESRKDLTDKALCCSDKCSFRRSQARKMQREKEWNYK